MRGLGQTGSCPGGWVTARFILTRPFTYSGTCVGYSSSFTRGARQDTRKLVTAAMMLHENLWRFVVSITFHTIWLERLNRIGDPTMSEVSHHAGTQSRLRRALSCFRNSTDQHGGVKGNTCWRECAQHWRIRFCNKLSLHSCGCDLLYHPLQRTCFGYSSTVAHGDTPAQEAQAPLFLTCSTTDTCRYIRLDG